MLDFFFNWQMRKEINECEVRVTSTLYSKMISLFVIEVVVNKPRFAQYISNVKFSRKPHNSHPTHIQSILNITITLQRIRSIFETVATSCTSAYDFHQV